MKAHSAAPEKENLGITAVALNFVSISGSEPEWVQILPGGAVIEGRNGAVFMNRNPAAFVEFLNGKTLRIPLDENHATFLKAPLGDPAPAFGWIDTYRLNEDGTTWGLLNLNNLGTEAVANKHYGYLSPIVEFNMVTGDLYDITSVALVNDPNFIMKSINSRINQHKTEETHMKKFLTMLGLAASATEDAIAIRLNSAISAEKLLGGIIAGLGLVPDTAEDAVMTSLNSATTSAGILSQVRKSLGLEDSADGTAIETALNSRIKGELIEGAAISLVDFVPRADYETLAGQVKELQKTGQAQEGRKIEDLLDAACNSRKISPASKDFHRGNMQKPGGIESFESYVAGAPELLPEQLDVATNARGADGLSKEDRDFCDSHGLDHAGYAAQL